MVIQKVEPVHEPVPVESPNLDSVPGYLLGYPKLLLTFSSLRLDRYLRDPSNLITMLKAKNKEEVAKVLSIFDPNEDPSSGLF